MLYDEILLSCKRALPPFNNKLLIDFKKNGVDVMPKFIDTLFKECIRLNEESKEDEDSEYTPIFYRGYRRLTPEEGVKALLGKAGYFSNVQISDFNWNLYAYMFEFEGEIFESQIFIPYTQQGAIIIGGTRYTPKFAIVEKGIHHTSYGILIKVMRAFIHFARIKSRHSFKTTDGDVYSDHIITVKAHNKLKGSTWPPLILYHLADRGFLHTIREFGFTPSEIKFVPNLPSSKQQLQLYKYFECNVNVMLQVKHEVFNDPHKRRFVISLLEIMNKHKDYRLENIVGDKTGYYQFNLGIWIGGKTTHERITRSADHLSSVRSFLDPLSQYLLNRIGFDTTSIFTIFKHVFYNLVTWTNQYTPGNLFNKAFSMTDYLFADLVNRTFVAIYASRQARKKKNKAKMIVDILVKRGSPTYIRTVLGRHVMFDRAPSDYNGNSLLVDGLTKIRSTMGADAKSRGAKHNLPESEMVVTPSVAVVESITAYPSSNPIVGGSINPYLEIDDDGFIVLPQWLKEWMCTEMGRDPNCDLSKF